VRKVPDDWYSGFGTNDVVQDDDEEVVDVNTMDMMDPTTYVAGNGQRALDPAFQDPGDEGAIPEDYYLFGPSPGEGLIAEW